jgi:hypothetical protein
VKEANMKTRPRRGIIFGVILFLMLIVYALSIPYFILAFFGVWSLPPLLTRGLLPLYALLSVVNTISLVAILLWRRWGIYVLSLTWVIFATLVYTGKPPAFIEEQYVSSLVLIIFYVSLLPEWQKFIPFGETEKVSREEPEDQGEEPAVPPPS